MQLQEAFGSLVQRHSGLLRGTSPEPGKERPTKQAKPQATKGGNGKARSNTLSKRPREETEAQSEGRLVQALAKLVLRQEASLQVLKPDSAWVLFISPLKQGPLSLLAEVAKEWKNKAKNQRMTVPLRVVLAHSLFKLLLQTLTGVKSTVCQSQRVAGGKRLGVPDLASGREVSDQGRDARPSPTRSLADPPARLATQAAPEWSDQPVPRYSPADGQPTVYSGFLDGGQCQRRPQQLCVAGTADNAGALSSAVLGTPVEEGRLQVNPSGRAHPSHDVIRKLQLLNSTSICYINAFVLAYLWACGSLDATDHQFYGACTQAWRDVLYARKPISIISLLSWRFLLRGWASLNQQHDVAEFAYFAICRFQPSVCFGTWQARPTVQKRGMYCDGCRRPVCCPASAPHGRDHHPPTAGLG